MDSADAPDLRFRPGRPDPAVEAARAARRREADRVSVRDTAGLIDPDELRDLDGGSADVLGSLLREADR